MQALKAETGDVDLRVSEVAKAFGPVLTNDLKIVKAHKSAAVRATVPVLTKELLLGEQVEDVKASVVIARDLLAWWIEHRRLWKQGDLTRPRALDFWLGSSNPAPPPKPATSIGGGPASTNQACPVPVGCTIPLVISRPWGVCRHPRGIGQRPASGALPRHSTLAL